MNKVVTQILIFFLLGATSIVSLAQSRLNPCFVNFAPSNEASLAKKDILPATAEKIRELPTASGNVKISVDEGVRLIYNNKNKAPFINIKIEASIPGQYTQDKKNLIAHLNYLVNASKGLKEKSINTSLINGFVVYSYSSDNFDNAYILTSYVFFPVEGVVIYVDFHNLQPKYRSFTSEAEYKTQRDQFINKYTASIRKCLSGK